jgi:hypothetical protein
VIFTNTERGVCTGDLTTDTITWSALVGSGFLCETDGKNLVLAYTLASPVIPVLGITPDLFATGRTAHRPVSQPRGMALGPDGQFAVIGVDLAPYFRASLKAWPRS